MQSFAVIMTSITLCGNSKKDAALQQLISEKMDQRKRQSEEQVLPPFLTQKVTFMIEKFIECKAKIG